MNFSNAPLCLKPERGPWLRVWLALRVSCNCPKLYGWANRLRHFYSNFCDIKGYYGKTPLRDHFRRTLHWVQCRRSHAAINTLDTEKLCFWLSLFLTEHGGGCFGPFLPRLTLYAHWTTIRKPCLEQIRTCSIDLQQAVVQQLTTLIENNVLLRSWKQEPMELTVEGCNNFTSVISKTVN